MSIVKVAVADSNLFQDTKDPRLLPLTERHKPQMRLRANKSVLNFGLPNNKERVRSRLDTVTTTHEEPGEINVNRQGRSIESRK
jgi:hypothetical protein